MPDGNDKLHRAASALFNSQISADPTYLLPSLRPATVKDGYTIQDALNKKMEDHLGPAVGAKIASFTASGVFFQARLFRSPTTLTLRNFVRPAFECEIAVRLKNPLLVGQVHSRESVSKSIGEVFASQEILDLRQKYMGRAGPLVECISRGPGKLSLLPLVLHLKCAPQLLVMDNILNWGCIIGEPQEWTPEDLISRLPTLTVQLRVDGQLVQEGRASEIMKAEYGPKAHPLDALVWFAKSENARDRSVPKNYIITLGATTSPPFFEPSAGTKTEMEVGSLGKITTHWQ